MHILKKSIKMIKNISNLGTYYYYYLETNTIPHPEPNFRTRDVTTLPLKKSWSLKLLSSRHTIEDT